MLDCWMILLLNEWRAWWKFWYEFRWLQHPNLCRYRCLDSTIWWRGIHHTITCVNVVALCINPKVDFRLRMMNDYLLFSFDLRVKCLFELYKKSEMLAFMCNFKWWCADQCLTRKKKIYSVVRRFYCNHVYPCLIT